MDMFLLACSAAARCCSCSAAQRSGNRMGASAAVRSSPLSSRPCLAASVAAASTALAAASCFCAASAAFCNRSSCARVTHERAHEITID